MSTPVSCLLERALSCIGDRYIFGVEVALNDPNPPAFDCSEMPQWYCAQCGLYYPDGSWLQYRYNQQHGLAISIVKAKNTPGAQLYIFRNRDGTVADPLSGGRPSHSHTATSLGNGQTIEARGHNWPVQKFSVEGRGWTHAALIYGADYSQTALETDMYAAVKYHDGFGIDGGDPHVKEWQELLGFTGVELDGKYGDNTKARVAAATSTDGMKIGPVEGAKILGAFGTGNGGLQDHRHVLNIQYSQTGGVA